MDFSKTKLHQRTRSAYDKLYLGYNEKQKLNGRRRKSLNKASGTNLESNTTTSERSETQRLIALLHSRTIEESPSPVRRLEASSTSGPLKRHERGDENYNFHAAGFSSRVVEEEIAPPAELANAYKGSNLKRKASDEPTMYKSMAHIEADSNQPGLANTQQATKAREENRNLQARCSEYEKTQEQLKLKVIQLEMELREAQDVYSRVLYELSNLEKLKGKQVFDV